jgi:hypothetical protein
MKLRDNNKHAIVDQLTVIPNHRIYNKFTHLYEPSKSSIYPSIAQRIAAVARVGNTFVSLFYYDAVTIHNEQLDEHARSLL